jgi:hypothetical protein
MASTDLQHNTDSSSPARGMSLRDGIKRKSTKQISPIEEQESKQHEEGEKQEEKLTPRLRRRTLSVAPEIEIIETLALDDYTPEEISAYWFDDDDYDDMAFDCEKIIGKMNKRNGSINRNKYCTRGLERMTDIGLALINCNRNDSYDAVLEEQDVQWDKQEDHHERIAQLYREVASRRCHVEAHQRGMQDALVVEELFFLDEGRKNKDEVEVQTVCSLGMYEKRKGIQSPMNTVIPPPSIPEKMPARCA